MKLSRAVMQQFDQYVKLNKKIPPEIPDLHLQHRRPGRLADTIAATCRSSSKKAAVLDSQMSAAWKTCSSSSTASGHP